MIKINIKPMSVNKAWQGRRFKTPAYKKYERDVLMMLPKITIPSGKLIVTYEFGFSNKLADIDNPNKQLGDILAKKYGFNDRDIYEMHTYKKIVPIGQEYISFRIEPLI